MIRDLCETAKGNHVTRLENMWNQLESNHCRTESVARLVPMGFFLEDGIVFLFNRMDKTTVIIVFSHE
jgi:hypothetical protein